MKKKLLLFAALLGLSAPCFATPTPVDDMMMDMSTLDGKDIKIHATKGDAVGKYLVFNGTSLAATTAHSDDNCIWHAVYDQAHDGVTLSMNGTYICAMPNASGNAMAVTTNETEAGYFRFFHYPDSDNGGAESTDYIISTSHLMNGTQIEGYSLGAVGDDPGKSNVWVKENSGSVIRYGSAAPQSKWAYEIVDPADPTEPVVYMPVTSMDMMVEGADYVVAAYNHNWGSGENADKRILVLDNTNSKFVTVANVPSASFAVWTAGHTDYTCNSTSDGHTTGKLFTLSQNGRYINQHTSGNVNQNATTATSEDATNAFEFFIKSTPSGASADNTYYAIHYGQENTWMKYAMWVDQSGRMGFGSQYDQDSQSTSYGSSGDKWTTYYLVYLVIDPENLEPAAKAFWNHLKEENIAANPSYSEEEIANIRAFEDPDISGFTASTLEAQLRSAFLNAMYSIADFTEVWTPSNTTFPSGQNSWNTYIFNMPSSAKLMVTTNNANMKKVGDNYDIRGGSAQNSPYQFVCHNPLYTVVGFEFTATGTAATIVEIDGVETALSPTEAKTFRGMDSFTIKGSNDQVLVPSFTVRYAINDKDLYNDLSANNILPKQTGWYRIMHIQGLSSYMGEWITAGDDEYPHDGNYYNLHSTGNLTEEDAAKAFFHIEVDGDSRYVRSQNGHYIINNCTSSLTQSNVTFAIDANNPLAATIGAYWSSYVEGAVKRIGQSHNAGSNRWLILPVTPEVDYDLWTVTITGDTPNATNIAANSHITVDNAANRGAHVVYNGATLFMTQGTTLTAADIVPTYSETEPIAPIITVDNTAKTINVNLVSTEEYIASKIPDIEAKFAPFVAEEILDQEVVESVIAEAVDGFDPDTDANNILSAEELAGIQAYIDAQPTADAQARILETINKLANKFVKIRSLNYNNVYMVDHVSGNNTVLWGSNAPTALGAIWELVASDIDGAYYLYNINAGMYSGNVIRTSSSEADIPMTANKENAHAFTIEFFQTAALSGFGLKDNESTGTYHYLHSKGGNNHVCKWNAPSNATASAWAIQLVEQDELEIGMEQVFNETGTGYVHKLTFASAATHSGVTYADHHNIHIWQIEIDETADDEDEQPEEGGDMNGVRARVASARSYHRVGDESLHNLSLNNAEVDDSGVSFTLNSVLPAGDYEVALPSAVLLADGKHNKAATATFRVDNNGAVTGIHEAAVTLVAMPGADVIYDLQGRRLSKPVHGINIINGRKVLVK